MSLLSDNQIRAVHAAALSAGLDRTALLAVLPRAFSQSIPSASTPSGQLLVDLHFLDETDRLSDESVPLVLWLVNALHLAAQLGEGRVFEAALQEARAVSLATASAQARRPAPTYRSDATRALGVELERERARKRALDAAGMSTEGVSQRILEIRRKLREGGQLREGDVLGRYLLLEQIGRGGFAVVWKALDPQDEGIVAIKVLHPNLAGDAVRRERFVRGAREMAGLDHRAIVRVLAPSEEDEGFHFFVMEYVNGEDLQHAVLKLRVPKDRALPIVLAVGSALAVAHDKGLVHRDVKPANILLGIDNEPKLTDFDLVGGDDTTGGTRTGAMGSFVYAAPEMLEHPQDADARADVFGLAMTAVFVIHGGTLPMRAFQRSAPFVDALACGAAMKAVLKRALDWEPARRFKNAREFCTAVELAADRARPPVVRQTLSLSAAPNLVVGAREETRPRAPARAPGPGTPLPAMLQPWQQKGEDEVGRFAVVKVGSVVQRMRWIPPGAFLMGSPESEIGRYVDEGPQHQVALKQGYWLAETPCTQALWQAVMGENPSMFKGHDLPVEQVSSEDCQTFFRRINTLVPGLEARLPTEPEWEYACRAGTSGPIWADDLRAIAWYAANAHGKTQTVARKRPNPFGLYDMLGNVWEWCESLRRGYPERNAILTGLPAPRVQRGGSWSSAARVVRAAAFRFHTPDLRLDTVGFRVACTGHP